VPFANLLHESLKAWRLLTASRRESKGDGAELNQAKECRSANRNPKHPFPFLLFSPNKSFALFRRSGRFCQAAYRPPDQGQKTGIEDASRPQLAALGKKSAMPLDTGLAMPYRFGAGPLACHASRARPGRPRITEAFGKTE